MELYNHGGSVARGIHWALHELETKNRKELELLRKKKEADNHRLRILPMSQLGSIMDYKQTSKMHFSIQNY
jgi:hypothetical protein